MSKRRKKEAIAKIVVIAVLALCLILLAIFGIWLIGQLSGDNPDDPSLGSDMTGITDSSGFPIGNSPDSSESVAALVEEYIYRMQSGNVITLYYGELSVDVNAADAKGPYDVEALKEYIVSNGLDSSLVDNYLAQGNSPDERQFDLDYIQDSVYALNDMINKTNVQGYSIDGKTVTVYKSDEVVSVDAEKSCERIMSGIESGSFGRLEAIVNIDKSGEPNWQEIHDRIYVAPQNAEYIYNEDSKSTELVPEVIGYTVDIDEMQRDYRNSTEAVITFEAEEVLPEITAANIQEKMFPDLLSSYSSWYNSNEKNRTNNLKLAASAINGTVIMPGTRFSFNDTVGERTEEAGYMEATIYISDGMTDGLGGGICQVTSTLYCATLFGNFEIVERWNHGYTVSYVDLGRDATVSYGWLDFRFENNYDNPIMITTTSVNGLLTIEIYGTKVDEILVNVRHETVETLEPEIEIERDDTLSGEEYQLESKGKKGYVVKTYKSVKINGEYLGEELIHTDTYDPMDGLAKVGPNWTESSVTEATSETEETSDTEGSTTDETTSGSEETTASNNSSEPSESDTSDSSEDSAPDNSSEADTSSSDSTEGDTTAEPTSVE